MNTFRCIPEQCASLVKRCTKLTEIKSIHAQFLTRGLLGDPHSVGRFAAAIALNHPSHLEYSHRILDRCDHPTVFALNSMIRAHSKSSTPHRGFDLYRRILRSDHNPYPDNYTFTFLVRTCAQLLARDTGRAVHAALTKRGFDRDRHVQSGLIFMYTEFGCLDASRMAFSEISDPDLVTQTAMVSALAKSGDFVIARQMFDEMPHRDHVAWNAMMAGYTQRGQSSEALNLFRLMQEEGVRVSEPAMVSVLSACAHLGALDHGRWAHAYIERNKLPITVTLGTALVDMYAKCGSMGKAMEIFWGMEERNVYSWSSAMDGLATNGAGKECLRLFSLMNQGGVEPNGVTFISVLRGCSVAGLVEEGQRHFASMRELYGIEPWVEHYGCMVNLYGRAGRLDEALTVINSMPMKPHAEAWGALLHACRVFQNGELGELASRKLVELEGKHDAAFVLLSNIYAKSRDWYGVSNVREEMKAKGVRKLPSCSVIEVDGEVHEFLAGDKSHSRNGEIDKMLAGIAKEAEKVTTTSYQSPRPCAI